MDLLEYLRIDDPIGAVPVHMVCGIWGTMSLGLFAAGKYGAPTPTGRGHQHVWSPASSTAGDWGC